MTLLKTPSHLCLTKTTSKKKDLFAFQQSRSADLIILFPERSLCKIHLFHLLFSRTSSISRLIFFPHISRIEASRCHPGIVFRGFFCGFSAVLGSLLTFQSSTPPFRLLNAATEAFFVCVPPPPTSSKKQFGASDYSEALRLYIYIQEWSLKSASFLIREGNLLPNAKPLSNYSHCH